MAYIAVSIREPLSDPAVSVAGGNPTRGPHVHYCYFTALKMAVCGKSYTLEYNVRTTGTLSIKLYSKLVVQVLVYKWVWFQWCRWSILSTEILICRFCLCPMKIFYIYLLSLNLQLGSGTKFRHHHWSGGTGKIIGPPNKFCWQGGTIFGLTENWKLSPFMSIHLNMIVTTHHMNPFINLYVSSSYLLCQGYKYI